MRFLQIVQILKLTVNSNMQLPTYTTEMNQLQGCHQNSSPLKSSMSVYKHQLDSSKFKIKDTKWNKKIDSLFDEKIRGKN